MKIKLLIYFGFVGLLLNGALLMSADAPSPVSISTPPAPSVALTKQNTPEEDIRTLWNEGKKSEAETRLKKWMIKDKKTPAPYVLEAEFRFGEKKFSKCLSVAGRAVEKFPKAGDAYYWRGRAYEAQNKPMDAANEYQAALKAKTTRVDAEESLSRVLALLGNSPTNP